ncbi:MAG: hypothetical protein IJH12_04160 [Clostridia bacterium]|nr:hypothetical protein [Clostridia bacterium]
MGKKEKKRENTHFKEMGDILRMDLGKKDIKNFVMDEFIESEMQSTGIPKNMQLKLIEAIGTPWKITIDKSGYATVRFDDGTKAKYDVIEIIKFISEQAESHIGRFYVTMNAYASIYLGKEFSTEEINNQTKDSSLEIDKLINDLYDGYSSNADEDEATRKNGIRELYDHILANDFVAAIFMWEQLKKLCKPLSQTHNIIEFINQAENVAKADLNKLDEENNMNSTIYRYIHKMMDRDTSSSTLLKEKYYTKKIEDDDIVNMLTALFTPEEIKGYIKCYGAYLMDKKGVVKQLISKKIVTEEELHQIVDTTQAFNYFIDCGNKELLKCMEISELVGLYIAKRIDRNQLTRNSSLKELLLSSITKDLKMDILLSGKGERIYNQTETSIIWELYEKDYFSIDDIKKLEQLRYLHVNTIIKNYNEDKRRKIAAAVGAIPGITDEKIILFFTPDIVLRELRSGINENQKQFYNIELRAIYDANNRDFEQELTDSILAKKEDFKDNLYLEFLKWFNEGILSIDTIKKLDIPENIFIDEYVKNNDETVLISYFNAGLISQDTVIDLLGSDFESKVFELIRKGMSARAIKGFYSTMQLIEMTQEKESPKGEIIPAELSIGDLTEIKEDIVVGLDEDENKKSSRGTSTVLDLYLTNQLTYAELYELVNAGIISINEANEINDNYNLGKDIEKLKRKGISGQPLTNLFNAKPAHVNLSPQKSTSSTSKSSVGIDTKYIIEFYNKIGAKDIIQINPDQCPVFNGYVIIPIIAKKIGFLEGTDGRTYILPLKVILEQINNPKSNMDLIGNATSRNTFNGNKCYVRSTNHTKNWIENTIKKAEEISPVMTTADVKTFKKNNASLINAVHKSYEYRKAHPII